jgi:hypothetical protein
MERRLGHFAQFLRLAPPAACTAIPSMTVAKKRASAAESAPPTIA